MEVKIVSRTMGRRMSMIDLVRVDWVLQLYVVLYWFLFTTGINRLRVIAIRNMTDDCAHGVVDM